MDAARQTVNGFREYTNRQKFIRTVLEVYSPTELAAVGFHLGADSKGNPFIRQRFEITKIHPDGTEEQPYSNWRFAPQEALGRAVTEMQENREKLKASHRERLRKNFFSETPDPAPENDPSVLKQVNKIENLELSYFSNAMPKEAAQEILGTIADLGLSMETLEGYGFAVDATKEIETEMQANHDNLLAELHQKENHPRLNNRRIQELRQTLIPQAKKQLEKARELSSNIHSLHNLPRSLQHANAIVSVPDADHSKADRMAGSQYEASTTQASTQPAESSETTLPPTPDALPEQSFEEEFPPEALAAILESIGASPINRHARPFHPSFEESFFMEQPEHPETDDEEETQLALTQAKQLVLDYKQATSPEDKERILRNISDLSIDARLPEIYAFDRHIAQSQIRELRAEQGKLTAEQQDKQAHRHRNRTRLEELQRLIVGLETQLDEARQSLNDAEETQFILQLASTYNTSNSQEPEPEVATPEKGDDDLLPTIDDTLPSQHELEEMERFLQEMPSYSDWSPPRSKMLHNMQREVEELRQKTHEAHEETKEPEPPNDEGNEPFTSPP